MTSTMTNYLTTTSANNPRATTRIRVSCYIYIYIYIYISCKLFMLTRCIDAKSNISYMGISLWPWRHYPILDILGHTRCTLHNVTQRHRCCSLPTACSLSTSWKYYRNNIQYNYDVKKWCSDTNQWPMDPKASVLLNTPQTYCQWRDNQQWCREWIGILNLSEKA